jgi:hypothetical protein
MRQRVQRALSAQRALIALRSDLVFPNRDKPCLPKAVLSNILEMLNLPGESSPDTFHLCSEGVGSCVMARNKTSPVGAAGPGALQDLPREDEGNRAEGE